MRGGDRETSQPDCHPAACKPVGRSAGNLTVFDIHRLAAAIVTHIIFIGIDGIDLDGLLRRRKNVFQGLHAMFVADAGVA